MWWVKYYRITKPGDKVGQTQSLPNNPGKVAGKGYRLSSSKQTIQPVHSSNLLVVEDPAGGQQKTRESVGE